MLQSLDIFLIGALAAIFALIASLAIAIAVVVRLSEHTRVFRPGELLFALGGLLFAGGLIAVLIVATSSGSSSAASSIAVVAALCLLAGAALMMGYFVALTIRERSWAASKGYIAPPKTLAEKLGLVGGPTLVGGGLVAGRTSGYVMWIAWALAALGALLMLASYIISRRQRAHIRAS